jgi:hypothetical protein
MEKKFLDVDFQDIGSAKISEIEFETLKVILILLEKIFNCFQITARSSKNV